MTDQFEQNVTAVALDMDTRIGKALEFALDGVFDGEHHKMWVIDQMVRALTGCPTVTRTGKSYLKTGEPPLEYEYQAQGESGEYRRWLAGHELCGHWDEGIPP